VRDKPLVLLDEPFAALGPALKAEMLDLVAAIAAERDLTTLMVSHDPADARRIAGEVILVADGQAHAPMATAELLDNPPAALRDYLGH
jgi:thiamine transport system ATP-binding protein